MVVVPPTDTTHDLLPLTNICKHVYDKHVKHTVVRTPEVSTSVVVRVQHAYYPLSLLIKQCGILYFDVRRTIEFNEVFVMGLFHRGVFFARELALIGLLSIFGRINKDMTFVHRFDVLDGRLDTLTSFYVDFRNKIDVKKLHLNRLFRDVVEHLEAQQFEEFELKTTLVTERRCRQ